ncbi:MAG TPA: acetyl-CoA C-acyltransferase [Acidimicrobiaceae bacterium]|nr:acetyl-CoA C-acyltransferase [Acidimicrobiaceae bacterium]
MTDAVIVAAVRTPIGRSYKGTLVDVDAFALAEVAVQAALDRSGVDPAVVDDLVLAESLQGGGVIGRNVALRLGLAHLPGLADNRHCAAALSAVQIAAGSIRAGMDKAIIAGGTESLSSTPRVFKAEPASSGNYEPWFSPTHTPTPQAPNRDMSITVGENTARMAGVTRLEADTWALHSNLRAAAARDQGVFDDEVVPVPLPGGSALFESDEQPRSDTTLEKLAALPVLHPELPDATVTAGNASGINDGAAAVMVVSDEFASAHGLEVLGRVRSWASVGVEPERTGLAPTLAIPKALDRAGMKLGDIDLFEINEAFCSMAVACTRALEIGHDIVNVHGSGCGLGHPVAATGTRMVVTTLYELRRRDAAVGCVSMCAGGGMGSAMVLERV